MNTVEFRIPLGPATLEFNTIDWSVCVWLTKIPERETIEFSAQTPSNYQVNNISHMPTENRIPPCLKLHCDSQIPNSMTMGNGTKCITWFARINPHVLFQQKYSVYATIINNFSSSLYTLSIMLMHKIHIQE